MTWTLNTHPLWQVLGGIAWMLLSLLGLALSAGLGAGVGILCAIIGVGYGIYNIIKGVKELGKKTEYDVLEAERSDIQKRLDEGSGEP